jgi:hypothetical protein
VNELALAGVTSVETANRFIAETYLPAHNARFAVAAAEPGSAFVAAPAAASNCRSAAPSAAAMIARRTCSTKTLELSSSSASALARLNAPQRASPACTSSARRITGRSVYGDRSPADAICRFERTPRPVQFGGARQKSCRKMPRRWVH